MFGNAVGALRAKFQSLAGTGFVRSVGMLVGGAAFAQALAVLMLPLLTRLYTPADFALLAVFSSILSICSVAACLRFEVAILVPESDEDAANLLALAFCACSVVAGLAGVVVWLLSSQIADWTNQPTLQTYLWLLPVGIWLASAYAAVQFWVSRKKRFGLITKTRIVQAIGGAGTQIGFGWAGASPFGLLLGQVISNGAGLFKLGRGASREDRLAFQGISWTAMRRLFREYDRFPKYSTFESLANSVGIQLPVIIIAAFAAGPEAGYLVLATRAMATPMSLIGSAVSQVYLSQAPKELRAKRLAEFTSRVIAGLVKTGVGPLIFAGIVAPTVFPLIFGVKWGRAGEFVTWMTPWFVMQFITSPISMGLHVTGNQRAALCLQLFGLALRVGAVICSGIWAPSHIVAIYAASGFLFYCIYLRMMLLFSEINLRSLSASLAPGLWGVLTWVFGGFFLIGCVGLASARGVL